MLFTPNQELLDGYDRFFPGQEYDIDEDRAKYLVSMGWGEAPDLPAELGASSAPATAVTLQADDVTSGSDAS